MFTSSLKTGLCIAALSLGAVFPVSAQPSAAAAEIRFQQLEREIRRLTGQIEEQNYEIRRLKEDLEDVRAKVNAGSVNDMPSLSSLEARGPAQALDPSIGIGGRDAAKVSEIQSPSDLQEPQVGLESQTLGTLRKPAEGGVVSSRDDAPLAYDHAYSFIKSRDFSRAEAEFAAFLRDHSDSDLAANAQYWFGETFYVRGDYDRSAREFATGYQKYPQGPKAASNLLKLGMSLVGLGKTEDACIAFKQLKSEYSDSSVPVLKRADSEMAKINCI